MSSEPQGRGSQLAHATPLNSLDKNKHSKGATSIGAETAPPSDGNGLPSVNLPRGGGAIRGIGEKFATSPATGTATASIPLPVTPGRSGFAPSLSFSYDSGAGNGPYGFGWSLSSPSVTRKTDLGLPNYHDHQESDVYQITGSEDLVPVLERRRDGKWCHQRPISRSVDGVEYEVYLYRPRIESAFSRIERWVAVHSRSTHWRSITGGNVTTIFGQDENSSIFDPEDPSHVFQWLISQSYDDKGNAIVFEYKPETCECVDAMAPHEFYRPAQNRTVMRYLKRVKYGNRISTLIQPVNPSSEWMFELVLDYGDHEKKWPNPRETRSWPTRSDPFSHSRSGFEVRTYRLCQRVLMFHHFPGEPNMGKDTLVSSLDISYFENGLASGSRLSSASCTSSFTRMSYQRNGDGYLEAAMPPVEIEYSEAVVSNETNYLHESALEGIPTGIQEPTYQFVDLDGEGTPGILAYQGDSYYYKPNLGGGKFGPPVELPRVPTLHVNGAKPPQLLDLLGDGHLDMVRFDGITPGFYKRNVENEVDGWEPWKAFRHSPNIPWGDPNMKFVDLTGDGHADILMTEDSILVMYPSLLEDGFGPPRYWRPPMDENQGPRLLLSDRVETLFLADMTGDGLSDFVRIRYHEVCYWPNRGYGCFGQKVSMSNPPLLQSQDQFSQSRVQLADIDGTGTTDILYLNGSDTKFFLNQSGNGWTDAFCISSFPSTADVTSVQVVDLLAKGTACLVWSSDLASDFGTQVRYVDLMANGKPYLVVKSRNNLGSETRYRYASSSECYLADKARGEPWVTKIPFPVQVVERTETFDYISKNRFVTQHKYHHGYYDGIEKEFRGFGMVETWDTEEISTLTSDSATKDWGLEHSNWDVTTTSPPVLTKTWYHTGAQLPFACLEDTLRGEYYPGDDSHRLRNSILPSSIRERDNEFIRYKMSPEEVRECYRALKGTTIHSEVYSFDGTEHAMLPYSVTHGTFMVELLQPQSVNQHALFHIRPLESVESAHDRKLYLVNDFMVPDPRVTHSLTLKTDMFGNALETLTVNYGRRYPDSSKLLELKDHHAQGRSYALFAQNRMTNAINSKDDWLLPSVAETRTYELYNFLDSGPHPWIRSYSRIQTMLETLASGKFDLPYERFNGPPEGDHSPCRRLLQHSQSLFRKNDLTGPLKLGEIESLGLIYMTLQLAITPQQMEDIFAGGKLSADEVPHTLEQLGGFVRGEDGNWWTQTPKNYFSPNPKDTPPLELEHARKHFFLPCRAEDIFSTPEKPVNSIVTYDKYDIAVQETRDALGNRSTVGERNTDPTKPLVRCGLDYRLMAPWLMMDSNRNVSVVTSDVTGLVVGTAILGKPEAPEGDSLDDLKSNLSEQEVQNYFEAPLEQLDCLLGTATSRIIHDHWAYYRTRHDPSPKPVWSSTLSRDTHVSQLADGEQSRITVAISYSDGFAQTVQSKAQAEPGPLLHRSDDTETNFDNSHKPNARGHSDSRWVASGWVVHNNKGKPVREFEPFFAATHDYESNAKVGVSPILLYDPLQRIVAMVMPDHTWSKTVTDPWSAQSWDPNDLSLISNPKEDSDVGGYFQRLAQEDYLPTWHEQRKDGQLGKQAQIAATKAAVHSNTPQTTFLDAVGHAVVSFEMIKTQRSGCDEPTVETTRTSVDLDIQGNQHEVYDARGRIVTTAKYNYLGGLMKTSGMENGEQWAIHDATGKGLLSWNSRKQRVRMEYDELRRSIGVYLSTEGEKEVLMETTMYGETLEEPEAINGRTRVIQVRDQSGQSANPLYDFKGNLLRSGHQLAKEYRQNINWACEVPLEDMNYHGTTAYDAQNRAIRSVLPDGTVNLFEYNVTGQENGLNSQIRGEKAGSTAVTGTESKKKSQVKVTSIDYDANGRRTQINFGNGARTNFSYDPLTFRLTNVQTRRGSGPLLQDLSYTYDAVGNVMHIRDDAQQTIFFRNRRVEPSNTFIYDSAYRLVEATGREHLGQMGGGSSRVPTAPNAFDYNVRLDLPGDGNAMGTYVETFFYDSVGNIKALKHHGSDPTHPGWTRRYSYNETSQLEPDKMNNRLSATTVGSMTENYRYDGSAGLVGNMTSMPHLSSMQWDFRDQLRSTSRQVSKDGKAPETTFYVYNSDGERVRKVTERRNSTGQANPTIMKERIYIGSFEIFRKYGSNGTSVLLERETLHVMGASDQSIALVETRTQGEETDDVPAQLIRYQMGNHLGSAVLELDVEAQIISYEEYYPFGSTSYQGVRSQLETPKHYRFTGKERDEENGLYYHGARYYAPWLGRWTSCDPAGMVDGSNLYMYARDNPCMLTDPDGRESSPKWQEVEVNDGTDAQYYADEGSDKYRRDTGDFSEEWHADGGDHTVTFGDQPITGYAPPTIEKIAGDGKKLDRYGFYLKYKDTFTPQQMEQVMQAIPFPKLVAEPDTTLFMGEGGKMGTEEGLARAEMADQLENFQPPTVTGSVFGAVALVKGDDIHEVARAVQIGDQVESIVSPLVQMGSMAAALPKKQQSQKPPPAPKPRLPAFKPNLEGTELEHHQAVQKLADNTYKMLNGNRSAIDHFLTPSQRRLANYGNWAQRIVFGNAMEEAMAQAAAPSGLLVHTGKIRPFKLGGADFKGARGTAFQGLKFQLTTRKQFKKAAHHAPKGMKFVTYRSFKPEP